MNSPFTEGGVDQEWPFSPKYFFLAGWGEGLRSNSKWGEKGIWVKRGGKARKPEALRTVGAESGKGKRAVGG